MSQVWSQFCLQLPLLEVGEVAAPLVVRAAEAKVDNRLVEFVRVFELGELGDHGKNAGRISAQVLVADLQETIARDQRCGLHHRVEHVGEFHCAEGHEGTARGIPASLLLRSHVETAPAFGALPAFPKVDLHDRVDDRSAIAHHVDELRVGERNVEVTGARPAGDLVKGSGPLVDREPFHSVLKVRLCLLGEIGGEQIAERFAKAGGDSLPVRIRLAWFEVARFDDAARKSATDDRRAEPSKNCRVELLRARPNVEDL